MEINITRFFKRQNPRAYSASVAERGPTAGADTWTEAMESAPRLLKSAEQLQAMRDHARGFGAWSDDEISAMSARELNALFVQMVAGDMRDYRDSVEGWDWAEYEAGCEAGQYSGRIGRGADAGTVWYTLGD